MIKVNTPYALKSLATSGERQYVATIKLTEDILEKMLGMYSVHEDKQIEASIELSEEGGRLCVEGDEFDLMSVEEQPRLCHFVQLRRDKEPIAVEGLDEERKARLLLGNKSISGGFSFFERGRLGRKLITQRTLSSKEKSNIRARQDHYETVAKSRSAKLLDSAPVSRARVSKYLRTKEVEPQGHIGKQAQTAVRILKSALGEQAVKVLKEMIMEPPPIIEEPEIDTQRETKTEKEEKVSNSKDEEKSFNERDFSKERQRQEHNMVATDESTKDQATPEMFVPLPCDKNMAISTEASPQNYLDNNILSRVKVAISGSSKSLKTLSSSTPTGVTKRPRVRDHRIPNIAFLSDYGRKLCLEHLHPRNVQSVSSSEELQACQKSYDKLYNDWKRLQTEMQFNATRFEVKEFLRQQNGDCQDNTIPNKSTEIPEAFLFIEKSLENMRQSLQNYSHVMDMYQKDAPHR